MKRGMIFLVTLSLLVMTAITDASSLSITVQPGPVEVKQGNDVTLWCLWCQDNKSQAAVVWHSPPALTTRTVDCVSFKSEKYNGISCGETRTCRWYNMTVKDVQWADKGKYRCLYIKHMGIVDLKVLVPVRDVSLIFVSNSKSKPLVLSKGTDAMLFCTTDCAYPAPKMSWFENGQPFKDNETDTRTESGCSGEKQGQKRTISSITVRGKYVEKERKESVISCEARNVFGEKNISKAIVVTYVDSCENVQCHPGRVCQATSRSTAICVCGPPDLCQDHHKEVCGDDGIMYPSQCELHRTACIKDKHIDVDHANNTCKPEGKSTTEWITSNPSPPQITIGGIVAAVVVSVVVFPFGVISIIVLVRRRRRRRRRQKEMIELRCVPKQNDMRIRMFPLVRSEMKYADASSVTTGYETQDDLDTDLDDGEGSFIDRSRAENLGSFETKESDAGIKVSQAACRKYRQDRENVKHKSKRQQGRNGEYQL